MELFKHSQCFGGHYSLFAQRLFLLHLSASCFFFVRHSGDPSDRSVLDSCGQPSPFPLILLSSQSSLMSTRCFFSTSGLSNLCKAGISCFLFIYPQNETPSSRQSSGPRRTASSGLSSVSALLLCICGLKHKSELKSSFVSQSGAAAFSFRPPQPGRIPPPPYQCAEARVWQR